MLTRQALFDELADMDIATSTVDHPAAFSVGDSTALYDQIPGGHTKNLFLKDARGDLYLVVAHQATQVDLKGLPRVIGSARLSFARADLLMEVLGVPPGSVTAFALANDRQRQVRVVLDRALMSFEVINLHPLENTATTSIARDDLLRFIRATGHEPDIVRLAHDG